MMICKAKALFKFYLENLIFLGPMQKGRSDKEDDGLIKNENTKIERAEEVMERCELLRYKKETQRRNVHSTSFLGLIFGIVKMEY